MAEPVSRLTFKEVAVVEVLASGPALWTQALEHVSGPVRIRFVADPSHRWTRASGACGAAGALERSADALCATVPLGALVAKFGGGSADLPPPAAQTAPSTSSLFTILGVGTYCVYEVADGASGALYLAMNDTLEGFSKHAGQMRVTIAIAVN